MPTKEKSTLITENQFSILKLIFTLLSIIMLRLFLENFVYPNPTGYFFPIERFIHAILYFSSLFVSLSILLYFFTKVSFESILLFMIKVFLFILTVPAVDFLFNIFSPEKASMAYLIISPNKFLTFFFSSVNFFNGQGVTFGQHFASLGILLSLAFFVYKKNKNVISALLLIISGYIILFFYEMLPSFVALLGNNKEILINKNALDAYYAILNQSWISYYTEGFSFLTKTSFQTEVAHEIAMAKIFFISLTIQIGIIFPIVNQKIWLAIKKQLRIERIVYWFIIAIIGIIINIKIFGDINLYNPINIVSLTVFFILIILNGWLAALINDSEDIHIDTISNPTRPLIAKTISLHDWNLIQIMLSIFIVIGLATMNKATISLFIFAQVSYYLYSVKPMRLKRHFITSSVLIGFASIMAAMAGFFLVSPDQHVSAFPIKAIVIIGIAYALLSNLKDIKDFEGDYHEGIKTIPVVFGLENSKRIIAIMCGIVMITMPIILRMEMMFLPSICISIFLFYLFTRKKYQEKYIFLVFFIYALGLFFITP